MPSSILARSSPPKTIIPPKTVDQFPYGWRYKTKTLPNGEQIDYEEPLTAADFLDPQLGDCMIQRDKHLRSNTNLFTVFDNRYANDPSVGVFSDLKMVWGIPGLKEPAPDVAVVFNLQNQDEEADRPTFDVKKEGTRPCLVIEIMSPNYPGDDTLKVDIYQQAGIPEYIIINPHSDKARPFYEVWGYRLVSGQYKPIKPDKQGRLLSQTTNVWFSVHDKGRRLRLRDAGTGKWLLNARETEAALFTETKARLEAEERALVEARARLEAEKKVLALASARLEAEQKAQAEAKARLEAETQVLEKEAQVHALKKRLQELESQPNLEGIPIRD